MLLKRQDKEAVGDWDEFLESIRKETPVDTSLTTEEHKSKLNRLEKPGNQEEWFKEFFPKFCFAEPAKFHKESTKNFLESKRCVHRRAWARGLSKSTRRMMEIFYKMFVQKVKINMLMISKSEDNAIRLLAPYKGQLEANQRIIHYYGKQQKSSGWTEYEFTTRSGSAFRAVGTAQNPRGAKLDELRINTIVFDDADDDEVCMNEDRLDKVWKWSKKSVIPTVEISRDYWICWDNNVIAEDSLSVRAKKMATINETVNIRDENGVSSWLEKNSEEDIEFMFSLLEEDDIQTEYFNNPMEKGNSFPEMKWGKCPRVENYDFVVVYADPSTSNNDKPKGKSRAKNSQKAVVMVGFKDLHYYIHKCFVDVTSNATFIEWMYQMEFLSRKAKERYMYIENNSLQDPFYQQVLRPLILQKGKEVGVMAPITGDDRAKPDKFFRVDGTLKPKNDNGLLVLNVEEKEDKHMKRLEKQFEAVKPSSKNMDGPDAVEGAVFKIDEKAVIRNVGGVECIKRNRNNKKY